MAEIRKRKVIDAEQENKRLKFGCKRSKKGVIFCPWTQRSPWKTVVAEGIRNKGGVKKTIEMWKRV